MANTTLEKVLELAPELANVLRNVRQIDKATVVMAVDSTDYTVAVNNTLFTFNSGVSATELTIATGLVAAVNAGSEPVTAIDNADNTYSLRANDAGVRFFSNVDTDVNQTVTTETQSEIREMLFNRLLSDATLSIKEVKYKDEQEVAQRYWVAHKITLITSQANTADGTSPTGSIIREKVGDVEKWYDPSGESGDGESEFLSTTYGKMFLSIRSRHLVYFV